MRGDAAGHRPQWPILNLLTLAAAVFLSITTEVLPTGLLPSISRDLGVSEARVGLLVTAYAVMVALFAMPLGFATARLPRRALLCVTLAGYALSNTVMAASDAYPVAFAARLVGGITHGVFWAMVGAYASRMVSPDRIGRAITVLGIGGTGAILLGVPSGTALGLAIGWRPTFALVALATLALAAVSWRRLPDLPGTDRAGTLRLADVARLPGLPTLATITTLTMLGHFSFITYVAPFLLHAGLPETAVAPVLLAYGLAGAAGLGLAGLLVDRRPRGAMIAAGAALTLALTALACSGGSAALAVAGTAATGLALGSLPVFLQAAMLRAAPLATEAAAGLHASAFNVGIGGGALLGGLTLDHWGAGALPTVAATLTGLALVAIVSSRRLGLPAAASH